MEPAARNCPQCDARLLQAPRPLGRVFGDVRALECSSCGFMIIEYFLEHGRLINRGKVADALKSLLRKKVIPQG
jgi:hypothetical protein